MFNKYKVSVVMPAFNEEIAIKTVVFDFDRSFVDEIVIADNNSTDNTKKFIQGHNIRLISEKCQGFGVAMRSALEKSTGDLIFLTESDGTFSGDDMMMFLEYIDNYDIVFGNRLTLKNLKNGTIKWYVFVGNIFISLIMNIRYGSSFRDLGCTYKIIRRESLLKIINNLSIKDGGANIEYILLSLKNKLNHTQVPVIYNKRVGKSKLSSNFLKSFLIGIKRLWYVFYY